MTYISAEYWNKIADMPHIRNCIFKYIFELSDEYLIMFIDSIYAELMKNGYPHKAISSFIDVAPLFFERRAITQYINFNKEMYFELRNVLPEILSTDEAVLLMERERMLNDFEKNELTKMLNNDWDEFIIEIYEDTSDYISHLIGVDEMNRTKDN
jgi:hypothetical protein